MPFSLRSDEELVAEARRALEALGVEVVIDSISSSVPQSVRRHQLAQSRNKVTIATSRAAVVASVTSPEVFAALLVFCGLGAIKALPIPRNRAHLDHAAAAAEWWGCLQRQEGSAVTCCACHQPAPAGKVLPRCPQCHANLCMSCTDNDVRTCPTCGVWYLEGYHAEWGVPWDMPRPAPTRRQASAAPPSSSSALPPRMAAAVGPDGWLRLPPRHQRMHPVDVLVDGVLAALDGRVAVWPSLRQTNSSGDSMLTFTRLPLLDSFGPQSASLEDVRRRLKQAVDRHMGLVTSMALQEVMIEVRRPFGDARLFSQVGCRRRRRRRGCRRVALAFA